MGVGGGGGYTCFRELYNGFRELYNGFRELYSGFGELCRCCSLPTANCQRAVYRGRRGVGYLGMLKNLKPLKNDKKTYF